MKILETKLKMKSDVTVTLWCWRQAHLLSIILCAVLHITSGCPNTCKCVSRDSGTAVFCIANNLTSIPQEALPWDTEELYLQGNHITTLTQGSFAGLDSLRTLVINDCNVASIERNTFTGLRHLGSLDLTDNKIRELRSHTFSGLSHLRRLILDGNALEVINNFAFNGLNLTKLSLEKNSLLTKLAPKAFENARVHDLYIVNASISSNSTGAFRVKTLQSSLRTLTWTNNRKPLTLPWKVFKGYSFDSLKLGTNGITDVSFLRYTSTDDLSLENNPTGPINFGRFPEFKHVRSLRLGNTSFSEIQPEYFRDLTDLSQLYLPNNGITSIPVDLKPILSQLTRLNLEDNLLHCNCEMLWFKQWVALSGRVLVKGSDCYTPINDHVLSLNEAEFVCTKPVLVDITRTVNVSEMSMMSIKCIGRGDPAPSIMWKLPDGDVVETVPSHNKSVFTNTGILTIRSTSVEDAGLYRCILKNPAGNSTAMANVDVYSIVGASPTTHFTLVNLIGTTITAFTMIDLHL